MDETLRMKVDIQHCIANNVTEFSTNYGMLLFEGEYKQNIFCLSYYNLLKISVKNNKLLFDIKLDKDKIKELSQEELQEVKKASDKIRYIDMIGQMQEQNKTEEQKEIEKENISNFLNHIIEKAERKQEEQTYRKALKDDYNKMNIIKSILDNAFNINCNIEEKEEYISISLNCKELTLNQEMLYKLILISYFTDIFTICPLYKENEDIDNEEVIGVRLFFGIQLKEGE